MNGKTQSNSTVTALIGIALAMTVATSTANAESVDRRIDADDDGYVSISNVSGSIEVSGWSRSEIEVTGTLGDDVEELYIDRDGDHVVIKVKIPRRSGRFTDASADLKIQVPEASSLSIATVSADITTEGVRGEQELQAVSGNVSAQSFGGEFEAESVSGRVRVRGDGAAGETQLVTVSGEIVVNGIAGEVMLESVSGSIDVEGGVFERVALETVNGAIDFSGALEEGGRLDAETVNGSVEVDFTGPVSARIEIETFNGKIRNCFGPKPERTSRYSPGWELEFTEGDGDGRVSIATLNGAVSLCKQ